MAEVQAVPAPVPVVETAPVAKDVAVEDTAKETVTIDLNDAYFCKHWKEVCAKCSFDSREENDAFYGFDPIDREGLEAAPAVQNKEGAWTCKKHGSQECTTCFGWKKQITKLRAAAKKAPKKAKHWTADL